MRSHCRGLFGLVVVVVAAVIAMPSVAAAQSPLNTQPGTSVTLYPVCIDPETEEVYQCFMNATSGYYAYTGGHNHEDSVHDDLNGNGTPKYYGRPDPTSFHTATTSSIQYRASAVGQVEYIQICADFCNSYDIDVMMDLVELCCSSHYEQIGETTIHPDNHFVDPNWEDNVLDVIEQYWDEYHNDSRYQTLGVNDITIDFGGKFDICITSSQPGCSSYGTKPWQSPHAEHDYGRAVDFRWNNTVYSIINDSAVEARFVEICEENDLDHVVQHSDHVHCRGGN